MNDLAQSRPSEAEQRIEDVRVLGAALEVLDRRCGDGRIPFGDGALESLESYTAGRVAQALEMARQTLAALLIVLSVAGNSAEAREILERR